MRSENFNPGDLIIFHECSGREIGIIIRVVREGVFDDFGVHVNFVDDDAMSYHYYFNELSRWETKGGITVHRVKGC